MMEHFETIPPWKMPDDEIIQKHEYYVFMRIDFIYLDPKGHYIRTGDLTEYYDWVDENNIFMEHNIVRQGYDGKRTVVMFVFEDAIDAMAFKLTWKEFG